MTRTRAADDFVAIRARMEELRRPTRSRAADDFETIRARMVELRRERAQASAETGGRSVIGPRPYHRAGRSETEHEGRRWLLPRSRALSST